MTVAVARLSELEGVIERGQQTFAEVGQALLEIRDGRLYRASHATFEDYCRERWGWTSEHGYRLMDAAQVAQTLPTGSVANEAQARELVPLKDQPEALRNVWASVIERAEREDEPVTASVLRRGVRDYIRGQAAESEAELQRITADWTDAQREAYRPEMLRQQGELARLVSDVASLQAPEVFVAAHRGHLPPQTVEQARLAHEWLARFLTAWSETNGHH